MKINLKYFPHYARYKKKISSEPMGEKSRRIILFSDTHITKNPIFNKSVFQKGLEEILKIKNVDYIIHLGDITHNGTYLEYELACNNYLKDLIKREDFFSIPGNHDAKNVGYLLFEEFLGARKFEIIDKDLIIAGIDSSIPDQDSGKIGLKTLERTKEQFLNNPDKTKIFCFHHQLIPIPLTGRERSAVIDSGDALEMILKSNIDIVLNGHRHISNVYSCTDGDEELVIFNSGTFSCNKTRYKELFTYTVVDIFDKAITFRTKKILTEEEIERGRYINRVFNTINPKIEKDNVVKFVQIANTHFSKNNFDGDMFKKAVNQINSLDIDLIIHSGDITNSNSLEEFEMAMSYLKDFKHPLLLIPGDNDLRTIGWDLFPKMLGALETNFENDKLRVVGINSIDKSIENGNVGRKKIKEIINYVKNKEDDKINIVTLYHNLIPHPKTKFKDMLSDSGNVLKFFTDHENNIHFILTGHDHISFSLQLEDTIMASCGTLSSKDLLDLEGNTYNIINCHVNGLVDVNKVIVDTNSSKIIGQYWINTNF